MEQIFYKVEEDEINLAEEKLGFTLPLELKEFYRHVGYGFMNKGSGDINRLVGPSGLVQIALKEDFYEEDPDLEVYNDLYHNDKLLFFEVNEGLYLAIDKAEEMGKNKIYCFDKKIADSLAEFINDYVNNPDLIRNIEL